MEEQYIPWNPIPPQANWYTDVQVMHFEQQCFGDGVPLSIIVTSTLKQKGSKEHTLSAWRITFHYPNAFRMLPMEKWHAAHAATIRSLSEEWALWEVVHSHWLAESSPSNISYPLHHFVIASWESVYEIAAAWWESEQLLENWRRLLHLPYKAHL